MIAATDYSKMEFNPLAKGLVKTYPKLKDIMKTEDEPIIKFILLMYDVKSPLRTNHPDIVRRKEIAAGIAGIKEGDLESVYSFTKAHWVDETKVVGEYDELLTAVTGFLHYQNSRLWSLIVVNEQSFYEYQRRIMAEIGGEVDKDALSAVTLKTKLLEAIDAIHKRLENYYRELSGEDKVLEDIIVTKRWSPEAVASVQTNR